MTMKRTIPLLLAVASPMVLAAKAKDHGDPPVKAPFEKGEDTLKTFHSSEQVHRRFCTTCGCQLFIEKPFDINSFRAQVSKLAGLPTDQE